MDNYREKLGNLGIDVHKVRGNKGKITCPKCSHTRKKKKDPCLSVNITEGWYKCHNCGWSGTVKFDQQKPKNKEYKQPNISNQTQCSDEIVKWFLARGISQSTLNKCNVMSGMTWMPQTQKEEYCIQFNYIKNGNVINIKHRDGNKNFRMESGAELSFYGLDDLKDDDNYIIIVEGEIDKLSFTEAGIDYCISVPNGASKQKPDGEQMILEYLDNCWEYFDNNKTVILAVDDDMPGMILREELARRIGKNRCRKVHFNKAKDANEFLVAYGPDALKEVVSSENLIEYPLEGVVEIDDVWDEVNEIMDNGLKRGVTTGVFHNLDKYISFDGGKLCVVTGIPNSGKSPFVDMVMIILSIRYGWKWGVCSMENKPISTYIVKLCEKIYGRFIRPSQPLPESEKDRIRNFVKRHFFFIEANYESRESDTMDFILDSAKGLVMKHGIKGLVIDPWNKIEHNMKSNENETNYVSRVLDDLIRFGVVNDLFTFLVAHPAKQKRTKGGEYEVPDLYSVSGSSNFFNKPDWGITVHRNYTTMLTEIHITKAKWDHLGQVGRFNMKYNGGNGRLGMPDDKPDFTNWLDSLAYMPSPVQDETEYIDYETEVFNGNEIPEDAPF